MKSERIPNEVKSILRYPGGKSRAVKAILPHIPSDFSEFREPFVGGGSIFIAVKQRMPSHTKFIINDLHSHLMFFWEYVKKDPQKFRREVLSYKNSYKNGRELFNFFKQKVERTPFEKAIRFFIMNRISFSGAVDASGYSDESFHKRFTYSMIDKIVPLGELLKDVTIDCGDYKKHLTAKGENVFLFIDPPYLKNKQSKLYGRNGILHKIFQHDKLSYDLSQCSHRWLATLDDTPEIRDLYDWAYMYEWKHQYGMNNWKKNYAKKGKELFISNYEIHSLKQTTF
ncbi:MAG: DNA adenine methylase [Candidatus Heimdallarchaeaceae archaeon]